MVVWASVVWAQEPLPDCAVLDLEGVGVDSVTSRTLSEKLRADVFASGSVRMVERNRMDEILAEQGFQQTGCTSSECHVQTGKLLGVTELIAGSVSYLPESQTWSISLSRLDVETGAILKMGQWSASGGVDTVLHAGLPMVVATLMGTLAPEPAPIASAPAAQPGSSSNGFSPLSLALVSPVQAPYRTVPIYGLAVDALYGRHDRVYGLAVGAAHDVDVRMAGLFVGVFNRADSEMWGLQAGVVNMAGKVRGLQVGLVNDCGSLQGVQIGLLNRVHGRAHVNFWLPILNAGF